MLPLLRSFNIKPKCRNLNPKCLTSQILNLISKSPSLILSNQHNGSKKLNPNLTKSPQNTNTYNLKPPNCKHNHTTNSGTKNNIHPQQNQTKRSQNPKVPKPQSLKHFQIKTKKANKNTRHHKNSQVLTFS